MANAIILHASHPMYIPPIRTLHTGFSKEISAWLYSAEGTAHLKGRIVCLSRSFGMVFPAILELFWKNMVVQKFMF
jgi:hypothetical protein